METTPIIDLVPIPGAFEPKFDTGDVAWTLTCTALVWLMVPGIGFFYSGMARSHSALSLIILCCWSIAIVSIQWFMFGYSLAFSEKGGPFIGGLDKIFLNGVTNANTTCNPKVPEVLCCIYHGMIAGITPALVIGAIAERGRFLPTVTFMFFWTTFVYDFLAYWQWGKWGWIKNMNGVDGGGLDFAGGNPVHVACGAAAIAYVMILGEREGRHVVEYKPHNVIQVVLGTSLMWFGWFGFNGGNALGANTRSAIVILVTNLSASFGGITWALIDWKRNKSFSALSFCFGAVAGLVTITPASGFIRPGSAPVFGILGAISCRFAADLKHVFGIDDALDVVNVHGIGGIVGTLLTGIFAEKSFAGLDGSTDIQGGWLDKHWVQIVYQLVATLAGATWSFAVTYGILWCMNKTPGLKLRVDANTARMGLDKKEIGEHAYERISNDRNIGGDNAGGETGPENGKTTN